MPLLREEAEKLSNNTLEQGVIEEIIDRDDLFAVLPFVKVNSKAYLYNREDTLAGADFLDPNEEIQESASTFKEVAVTRKITISARVFLSMRFHPPLGCMATLRQKSSKPHPKRYSPNLKNGVRNGQTRI